MMTRNVRELAILWVSVPILLGSLLAVHAQEPKPLATEAKTEEKKLTELQVVKAQLIKLQMEYLEVQKNLATCQQQTVAGTARAYEMDILKSIDAKPGQKFDWNTMTVTPVPVTPQKPDLEKKP